MEVRPVDPPGGHVEVVAPGAEVSVPKDQDPPRWGMNDKARMNSNKHSFKPHLGSAANAQWAAVRTNMGLIRVPPHWEATDVN